MVLAVLGAVRQEVAPLRRSMAVHRKIDERISLGRYGRHDVVLVETGMGRRAAEAAVENVLSRYPVRCVIALGFAGALSRDLHVGDVVIARELYRVPATGDVYRSDGDLLFLASRLASRGGRFLIGRSLTVDHVLVEPAAKQSLGEAFCAQVADMESYWIAAKVASSRMPFLAARVVLDLAGQRLPDFNAFLDDGHWRRGDAAKHFAANPKDLQRMAQFCRHIRPAQRSLAGFADAFIEAIPEASTSLG